MNPHSPDGRGASPLSPLARFALFDYERGSRAYDLAWALVLLLLFLIPPAWLGDPMVAWP